MSDAIDDPVPLGLRLVAGWAALARFGITPNAAGGTCDFFAACMRAQVALRLLRLPAVAVSIASHAAYLSRKCGLADMAELATAPQPDTVLTREAVSNITGALGAAPDPDVVARGYANHEEEALRAGVPGRVLALIRAAEEQLEGWCTREKALTMARLILQEQPRVCVEIGVYGGRSLIPCAAALEANGTGRIYGIECWDAAAALSHATTDENDAWWTKVDFRSIKRRFCGFVAFQELTEQVCVVEAPSHRAAQVFDTIDFLHIDGSHATIAAAEDVLLYATKVRSGGLVVFDDTDWDTTRPALQMLEALAKPMMTPAQIREANYAIFRVH